MQEYTTLFGLAERTAVVVGAGSGIGRCIAHGLAAHGAFVVCADRDKPSTAQTADEITDEGGAASVAVVDITEAASVAALADEHATADVLVCTAGIHCRKALAELTDVDVDRVLDVNVTGNLHVMRAFAERMGQRGHGSIVAFSSIRASVAEPGTSIYGASKAALTAVVKGMASEFGPQGVRVNAIAPSPVDTPLVAAVRAQPDWYRAYADKSVLRRWARPDELVGPVLLLASDAGSFITGSELLVDGGWIAADGRFDPPL